jgi:hypothetical protein
VRLRDLEQRINELKEEIFRSKARLSLLAESVLQNAVGGSRARSSTRTRWAARTASASLVYSLDGAPILNRTDDNGSLADQREVPGLQRPDRLWRSQPGVNLEYIGAGLPYMKGYRFRVRSTQSFSVPEGKAIQIRVVGFEKGGPLDAAREPPRRALRPARHLAARGRTASRRRRTPTAAPTPGTQPAQARRGRLLGGADGTRSAVAAARCSLGAPGRRPRRTSATWARSSAVLDRRPRRSRSRERRVRAGRARTGPRLPRSASPTRSCSTACATTRAPRCCSPTSSRTTANSPAFPQSLYLLGDALYQAGDRYGARTRFREVLDHGNEPMFRPFVQRALGRLIEIEIASAPTTRRAGRRRVLPSARADPALGDRGADHVHPREVTSSSARNPDYDGARQAFESIPARRPSIPRRGTSSARSSRRSSVTPRPSRPSSG